jgi:hypothetical protein
MQITAALYFFYFVEPLKIQLSAAVIAIYLFVEEEEEAGG